MLKQCRTSHKNKLIHQIIYHSKIQEKNILEKKLNIRTKYITSDLKRTKQNIHIHTMVSNEIPCHELHISGNCNITVHDWKLNKWSIITAVIKNWWRQATWTDTDFTILYNPFYVIYICCFLLLKIPNKLNCYKCGIMEDKCWNLIVDDLISLLFCHCLV